MKKRLGRLTSLVTVLAMCMTLMSTMASAATPAGAPSMDELEAAVSDITLTTTAKGQANGSYKVQYKANLTMEKKFAEAVVAMNTGDYLKKLQFTCILEDELVKLLSVSDVSFTFSGAGAVNFVPDGSNYVSKTSDGAIEIRYKLNADEVDAWRYMRASEIEAALMQEIIMTSAEKIVSAEDLNDAKGSDGKIATSARVEITYAGGDIPVYDEPYILAAEGQTKLNIVEYSAGGGTVEPATPVPAPSYDVKVENSEESRGQINSNITQAKKDSAVVIRVKAEEGYRLVDLAVTDKNGNVIVVTRNDDGTYSFNMPASDVSVVPTFDLSAARPEKSGVSEYLNVDDHIAFMVGDDKGTFRPNANITRAEVAQIFYALLKDKNVPLTTTFTDVKSDAWYATAVNTMAALGVVKGVGDGRFEPTRPITRAEFATIASNFAQTARDRFDFVDVDESHWAYPYISAVSFYGWVAGVGGNKFEPDRPIVRAEAATIVNNMLGRIGDREMIDAGEGRQFPDVNKSYWGWYEIGEATMSHDHDFNEAYTQEIWLK